MNLSGRSTFSNLFGSGLSGLGFSNKKISNNKSQIPNNWLLILFEILILRFGIYL